MMFDLASDPQGAARIIIEELSQVTLPHTHFPN